MVTIFNEELHTTINSLESDHLGLAFDLLRESKILNKKFVKDDSHYFSGMEERRLVMSCILHGFCALESAISYFGYELFFNPDSSRYVAEDKRGLLLKKFLRTWDKAQCIEKLQFILSYSSSIEIPENLIAKLRELNSLRNWLVHGFTYKTTFLIEPNPDKENSFTVIDYDDDIDWKRKFPNTKFSPPLSLRFEDAYKSLFIVLEIFKLLSQAFSHLFSVMTVKPKLEFHMLYIDNSDVAKLIEKCTK